jgi:hypothetical protein
MMDKIIKNVALKLVNCYDGKTNLCFPKYRNGSDRISEQESKFFFSLEFEQHKPPFSFAIEVPTTAPFVFTGATARSALHDMAIYDVNDSSKFEWIIELKSGQPERDSIKKDFSKMAKAECNCVWFHTLKNANKRTIKTLLKKFNEVWGEVKSEPELEVKPEPEWKFAIVVLEQKKYYSITIKIDKTKTIKTDKIPSLLPDISKWEERQLLVQ